MKQIDYLIVGCGLFGSVLAERIANVLKKSNYFRKRDHIAGNIYSHIDLILVSNTINMDTYFSHKSRYCLELYKSIYYI